VESELDMIARLANIVRFSGLGNITTTIFIGL